MRTSSSSIFLDEGVLGWLWLQFGPSWWTPAGPVAGLLRSGKVQVNLLSFISFLFLFSVFKFHFMFC